MKPLGSDHTLEISPWTMNHTTGQTVCTFSEQRILGENIQTSDTKLVVGLQCKIELNLQDAYPA